MSIIIRNDDSRIIVSWMDTREKQPKIYKISWMDTREKQPKIYKIS